jgi:MoxR-vWA-beta-propeller ternary system domain bpX4
MENTGQTLSEAGPSIASFVHALANDGRIVVSSEPIAAPDEAALSELVELNQRAQAELAGEPPGFSCEAALWAANLLYQICQFVVCRDIGEGQIATAFASECPVPRGPETDWSTDLLLRHLPAMIRLAQQLSNGDPLVQELKKVAAAWPLSSVSISELMDLNLDTFIGQPALARLYADRIVAAGDTSRLGDPRVDDLLRADVGVHRELAPEIAKRLFDKEAPAEESKS